MQLYHAVNNAFTQLAAAIQQLTPEQYTYPCESLSKNTIGQHVRHAIELFQELQNGYNTNTVNYGNRKRDKQIEADPVLAQQLLNDIYQHLDHSDKELSLQTSYDKESDQVITIATNYYREVAYNLEHTIHHMALIRVGIKEVSDITLPEDFGVATSTVKHRKTCAQ